MTAERPPAPPLGRAALAGGVLLLVGLVAVAVALVGFVLQALPDARAQASAAPAGRYALADPAPAPPLELTGPTGAPFRLADLRPAPALVFFGYTHCPDVCPTTVGTITETILGAPGVRAVFVSIDPERDDPAALASYLRYLNPAITAATGTPAEIRGVADAWGISYGKIEQGSAGGYAMAHTADLFLVDGAGRLVARFPFGTPASDIVPFVRATLAEAPASVPPAATVPLGTPAPAAGTGLAALVVSTTVWSGGASPVILELADAGGAPLPADVAVRALPVRAADGATAPEAEVRAISPAGEDTAWVAFVDLPTPGRWRLDLRAADGRGGSAEVTALDPGSTAALGRPAPDVDTPTLDDVGGVVMAVTTQPQPDLRLSRTSTADARAAGRPYVLVIDSARFKVSPACGRAIGMARFLQDRWTDVAFIHLEPFEYAIVTAEPVLAGSLERPVLNRWAEAFGVGTGPWPATDMPWVFVVDGEGIVRAKYRGVVGSPDVDVVLALYAQG